MFEDSNNFLFSSRLKSMSEENKRENSPAGPSSTPGVASATHEPRVVMSSYVKQLLAEKQKLEENGGSELQLTQRLLANGKFRHYEYLQKNVRLSGGA